MNSGAFLPLLANAALLLSAALIYDLLSPEAAGKPSLRRQAVIGLAIGAVGIGIMLVPWHFAPGIVFDTRSVLLSTSGVFFGPVPTLIAMAMTGALRLAQGGAAAWAGFTVIVAAGGIGMAWAALRKRPVEDAGFGELLVLGVVVSLATIGLLAQLPAETYRRVVSMIALPLLTIYPLASAFLGGMVAIRMRRSRNASLLADGEERLRLALGAAGAGTFDWDIPSGRILWSRRHEELWGYGPGEFEGTLEGFTRRLHPEDRAGVEAEMTRCLAHRQPFKREFRVVLPDGEVRWIAGQGSAEFDAAGRPVRMPGVVLDVTERRRAEAQARMRDFSIDRAGQEIYWIDAQGRIVGSNETACRALGYSREELAALTVADVDPFWPGERFESFWRQLREQRVVRIRSRHRTRDGRVYPVEVEANYFQFDGHEYNCAFVQDITERDRIEQELLEREAELKEVNRIAGLGHYRLDIPAGKWTSSPVLDEIFGIGPDFERSAQEWLGLVEPSMREEMQAYLRDAVIARGQRFDREYRIVRRSDGCLRWVHGLGEIERGAAGEAVAMIGTIQDITVRREAEARVTRSEQDLRSVIDAAPDGVIVTRPDGTVLLSNRAFVRLFEVDPAAVDNPRAWFEAAFPDPGYRAHVQEAWRTQVLAASGPLRVGEMLAVTRPDGDERQAEVTVVPLADGRRIVSFIDVTERIRAEELIRRSAEEYRSLVATTTDGFWVIGPDTRLLDVNDAYCRMSGYERGELLRLSIADLDEEESPNDALTRLRGIVEKGSDRFESRHRRRDGHVIDVEVSTTWIARSGRLFAFIRDISERKRLEKSRLRSQKLESLGTLAGGIAHDFNNILSAIRGNAELAAEDVGEGHPAMASIAEIRKAGVRASELVRRITAFGRPSEARREVLALGPVLEEVHKLLRSTLPAGIALQRRVEDDAPQVLADASQVHEALLNLTTNAAHAIGGRTGTIAYALEAVTLDAQESGRLGLGPGRYARLSVTDSGCGMDEATMARIFDVFFTTKAIGEGTGLGLSMVYGIMQGHGGAVTVQSLPGHGSSFHLYFPAAGAPISPAGV